MNTMIVHGRISFPAHIVTVSTLLLFSAVPFPVFAWIYKHAISCAVVRFILQAFSIVVHWRDYHVEQVKKQKIVGFEISRGCSDVNFKVNSWFSQ